jgi:hypothetical protein
MQASDLEQIFHRLTIALFETNTEATNDIMCLTTDRTEVAYLFFRNLAFRHPFSVLRFVLKKKSITFVF